MCFTITGFSLFLICKIKDRLLAFRLSVSWPVISRVPDALRADRLGVLCPLHGGSMPYSRGSVPQKRGAMPPNFQGCYAPCRGAMPRPMRIQHWDFWKLSHRNDNPPGTGGGSNRLTEVVCGFYGC